MPYRTMVFPVILGPTLRHVWSEHDRTNGVNYGCDYPNGLGLACNHHPGLDIEANYEPLYATEAGVATFAGQSLQFNRPAYVEIKTANGDRHLYVHMSKVEIRPGQSVAKGQRIGVSGEQTHSGTWTPDGSGPHLHFELRRPGAGGWGPQAQGLIAVNPIPLLTIGTTSIVAPVPNRPTFMTGQRVKTNTGGVNFRSTPCTDKPAIEILPKDYPFVVTGVPVQGCGRTWYPVRKTNDNGGGRGFVVNDVLVPRTERS